MAVQEAPNSIDITDIQFKLHSKYQLFNVNASTPNYNGIDLLAAASVFGLIIVGKPSANEIQVLRLRDVVENAETSNISVRSINIPGEPYVLALNCDHTLLAVCYTVNRQSFMDVFAVQSFLSANVMCVLSRVSISNCDGVKVKQILWNPVIPNTMAMCLNDGTLAAYTIKSNSFEFNSLDRSENARCACWSPKGKQIVVAFPNGKLAQYKPDLKLAKTIPCTVQLFSAPFSPVAVQWLSTYQFAVVFVEEKEDAVQSLFIVNAPKSAPPSYINYYDITYSQTGPRSTQVFLIHILQWNLLLMASSNGTEIGVLGTIESGETPLWKQYTFIDEGRAELPLTIDKQDTFFIGLALETGCTHQITIGENQIPVMPMIHILSTHGLLLSFDLLNFQSSRVDICSPPQPLSDQSGLRMFRPIANEQTAPSQQQQQPQNLASPPMGQQHSFGNATKSFSATDFQQSSNLTFAIPDTAATSTPAKSSMQIQSSFSQMRGTPKPNFSLVSTNAQTAKPAMTNQNLFGAPGPGVTASVAPIFGGGSSSTGGGQFNLGNSKEPIKPFSAPTAAATNAQLSAVPGQSQSDSAAITVAKNSSEKSQPFLTLQPNYKPSTQPIKNVSASIVSNSENDAILRKLIKEEIDAFDKEFRMALNRSRKIETSICGKDEVSKLIKSIDEMQEITMQATESTESIKADVQSLRLTLYEMLAMQAEAQSKIEEYKKMGKSTEENLAVNQTHRRLVNKLQNLLDQNQSKYDVFNKQLDANWNSHLQRKRENDKARMRIPTLENVYQTLEKQHQILMKEKEKINKLKIRAGLRDSSPNKIKYSYSNTDNLKVNSLVDSVLSLTIGEQIKNERRQLNTKKIDALREVTLGSRKVNFIKPMRPDRKGLNSEVIIEKKVASAKAQKEKENLKRAEAERERAKQEKIKQVTKSIGSATQPQSQPVYTHPQQTQSMPPPPPQQQQQQQQQPPSSTLFAFGSGTVEKSVRETAPSVASSKATPFDTPAVATVASPFSIGTKTDTSNNMFGMTASPLFSSDSGVSSSVSGIQKTPTTGKIPLLLTPTAANSAPIINPLNPAAKSITVPTANCTPITAAAAASPFSASPSNIQASAKPTAPSTPATTTVATAAATPPSTTFKFDLGNSFNSGSDKPTINNKENSAPISAAPTSTSKTSSMGTFSFALGNSISSNQPQSEITSKSLSSASAMSPLVTALVSTPAAVPSSTPSSSGFSFVKVDAESSIFGGGKSSTTSTNITTSTTTTKATTTTTTTGSNAVISSSTDPSNIFQSFNICKPNVADSSNTSKGLFGSTSFGALATNVSSTPNTGASIFGASISNSAQSTTVSSNLFGDKSITTTTVSTIPTTSTTASVFGANSVNSSTSPPQTANIFGGAASPAAPSSGNLFGTPTVAKPPQSIFGGNVATSTSSSIFGGTASPQSNSFGASPFGGSNTTPTTNLFGGAAAASAATSTNNAIRPSGGSIFGGGGGATTNQSSGGSLFGGSSSFGSPQQSTAGSVFGSSAFGGGGFAQAATTSASSVFGGSFAQPTSNASPFGGGGAATAQTAFGGSPFGQTPQSPTQTGFGSPQQQQQGGGFGLSAIAASANPTFGSGATFGSNATFGSPKGFGTFASMNPNPSFTSPQQQNTLFESLGSSENAMTFGNLAQNQASPTPAAPKPFGGGSSFSSWR